jgi:hypothetical protein
MVATDDKRAISRFNFCFLGVFFRRLAVGAMKIVGAIAIRR